MQLSIQDMTLIEQLELARSIYRQEHGRLPTRLVLTEDDLAELNFWIEQNPGNKAYCSVALSNEPEILGMRYCVDTHAKRFRLFFQES